MMLIKNKRIRNLTAFIILVIILVGILLLLTSGKPTPTAKKPNIIFIMADDMGYSDIGCYGSEIATPNIDKLASSGIKMKTFYNNARCCPTRASLLTGEYPHQVGMGYMVTMPNAPIQTGSYQGFLDDRYPTIAEDLKKAGYHTYMSGKWHVGERKEHWPIQRGFDQYFGLISGASSFYEIIPQEKGKRHVVLNNDDYPISDEGFYMTDAFTDHAISYLNKEKTRKDIQPFFLYLAYTAPHFPLHALEADIVKYEKLYEQGWDITREKRFEKMRKLGVIDQRYTLTARPNDIPAWVDAKDKPTWVRKMAVYAAMIDRMDQNIGRLISTLKLNGQYNNTLIVFLSDNGGCAENTDQRKFDDPTKKIGAKGSYKTYDLPWANVSNTPFRKYKHFMHEGGIVTPFIMQWPAAIKPVKNYLNGAGHVIDLLPTALELAGAERTTLPGKSLSYLWKQSSITERTFYWEHEGNQAIRKANWKLVKDVDDTSWKLYNLTQDPTESNDLALTEKERVRALMTEYTVWKKKLGVKELQSSNKSE